MTGEAGADSSRIRPRPSYDPWHYQSLLIEDERADHGHVARVATLFLTGRECPWHCVMCDLWTRTTVADTPPGAIPAQLVSARRALAAELRRVAQIKLYNSSSFFDPRAVPLSDYDRIAMLLDGFDRVIVESHPALIGPRVDRFQLALRAHGGRAPADIEVAMGLETVHPHALERLNKRMRVDDFGVAADELMARGIALRVFLLISPPFIPRDAQDEWLLLSVEKARSYGATAISLIPTRDGNDGLARLVRDGLFQRPRLHDIERSFDAALSFASERTRLFVDLWDLDRFADCQYCYPDRAARLRRMNLEQTRLPPVSCDRCAAAGNRIA